MLNPLKFKGKDSNFFLISDLHWGHRPNWECPIWKMRGFNSPEEHEEGLIQSWNQECNFESIIFHLGDIIFNDPNAEKLLKLFDRLNFKELYLLPGNHLSGFKYLYYKLLKDYNTGVKQEVYPLKLEFNSIKSVYFFPNYVECYINNYPLVLSHYPLLSFNGQKDGGIHCHGHCHTNLEYTAPLTGKGKRLDVSWESFRKPVSFKFVKNFLKDRDLDIKDHHK